MSHMYVYVSMWCRRAGFVWVRRYERERDIRWGVWKKKELGLLWEYMCQTKYCTWWEGKGKKGRDGGGDLRTFLCVYYAGTGLR